MKALSLVLALTTFACVAPKEIKPILESTTTEAVVEGKDDPTIVAPDAVTTPASGSATPLVIVTAFVDYQCPACPRLESFLESLRLDYPDDIQIQYRHFPLTMHRLAKPAAYAVAAAHRQGGFECMAHGLFATQDDWSDKGEDHLREHVAELAQACGLDTAKLEEDMLDPLIADRVDNDFALGQAADVRGTPWLLVDGVRAQLSSRDSVRRPDGSIDPRTPPATLLSALVRRELREAHAQLDAGVPRAEIPRKRLFGNLGDEALVNQLLH